MWTLEQGLGDAFLPEVSNAWSTFYAFVSFHMKAGLHQARESA